MENLRSKVLAATGCDNHRGNKEREREKKLLRTHPMVDGHCFKGFESFEGQRCPRHVIQGTGVGAVRINDLPRGYAVCDAI